MCAIFGSKDFNKFKELADLNSYRGQHSYSISVYDIKTGDITPVKKELGSFTTEGLNPDLQDVYWIGHIQAPTTQSKDLDSVHPSVVNSSFLWHNGIIKEDYIKRMQESLNMACNWDTKLLHYWVIKENDLSEVDGTFSCLRYYDGKLYLFRNEISPMFIDDQLNISSTKFSDSNKTRPNAMLRIEFNLDNVALLSTFNTRENPYYFSSGV